MKDLSAHVANPRQTPQSEPIPGRESEMVENAAGGYGFQAGDWERLDRFLIIGTEGGTYYANERELTVDNAGVVSRCLKEDFGRTLSRITEVSDSGIAPKNDPAILALAMAFSIRGLPRPVTHERAAALRTVCRTGTHLFQFLTAARKLRGGGRSLNGAVRAWLAAQDPERLALLAIKYRQRSGWTWRDVLRRYRPKPTADRATLYAVMAGKHVATSSRLWISYVRASSIPVGQLATHVREARLPWEAVPPEHTKRTDVLEALFESMALMATVRHLSKFAAYGVLPKRTGDVIARITDEELIRKSRIHPVALMLAAHAYEIGRGRHLTWQPQAEIVDALDDAFQAALRVAEPSGKRVLVGIDTSASMTVEHSAGVPLWKIAAAMALTHVRVDSAQTMKFAMSAKGLALSKRMRITDAMRAIEDGGVGYGTNCSLPFTHAIQNAIKVDAFVVFTDSETWDGDSHPSQELQRYRDRINPAAKVVWCAMTAGRATCGDPEDARMLSITGFDSSAPKLIGDFIADRF